MYFIRLLLGYYIALFVLKKLSVHLWLHSGVKSRASSCTKHLWPCTDADSERKSRQSVYECVYMCYFG